MNSRPPTVRKPEITENPVEAVVQRVEIVGMKNFRERPQTADEMRKLRVKAREDAG